MSPVWSDPPARLELAEGDIAIWKALLERERGEIEKFHATLSEDEKQRAARFYFERDRDRFVIARGTLRGLLGRYLGVAARELRFRYGAQGKPSLDMDAPPLYFNVSHTQNMGVFAFARGRELGIDVEKVQQDFKVREIAGRFFSETECRELFALPVERQSEAFFLCWTRKEAYIKARGKGMHIPLDSFSVSLTPGEPASFRSGVDANWRIESFAVTKEYPGAVVYEGVPARCHFFSSAASHAAIEEL